MSHSAGKINVYDILGRAFLGLVKFLSTVGLYLHEVGQAQAKSTNKADMHEFSSGEMIRQFKAFVFHNIRLSCELVYEHSI